jgi:hypothetical protein
MSTIPFCIVCQTFGHEARGLKNAPPECPARMIRLQADYGDPGTRREGEEVMFNAHLHCNCGGQDSAHAQSCPRYGHDMRCDSCYVREQAGMYGQCANCHKERATRTTLRLGPVSRKPVDRLVLKLSISATLAGEEYDKLTEDQIDVMVEEMEKTMRKHLSFAVSSAKFAYEHLGMTFEAKKEI